VRVLSVITMELMQKYVKDPVGVDDQERWPPNLDAAGFLAVTESASSIRELVKVCCPFFFFYKVRNLTSPSIR